MSVELPDRLGRYRVEAPGARTLVLVGLTVAVQLAALSLVGSGQSGVAAPPATAPAADDPTTAAHLLGVLLFEVVAILGLAAALRYAPAWVTRGLGAGVVASAVFVLGTGVESTGLAYGLLAAFLVGPVVYSGLREYDLYWPLFDVAALALATYAAVGVGQLMRPGVLVVFLVAIILWDRIAVGSGIMGSLAGSVLSWGLPLVVLVPTRLRLDHDALVDAVTADGATPELLVGIGLGDLVLPAALAVSVMSFGGPVVAAAGVVVGTCLAIVGMTTLHVDGLRPAMPWLGSGAIGGFAVGLAISLAGVIG